MAKSDTTRPEVSEADPQRNKKYARKYKMSEQCLTCIVSNIDTKIYKTSVPTLQEVKKIIDILSRTRDIQIFV